MKMNFTAKSLFVVLLFSLFSSCVFSQIVEWMWVKGDSTVNPLGVHVAYNVPNISNNPPAKASPLSWTDNSGNFWVFGGDTENSAGFSSPTNDLWMYDALSNQWTIMLPLGPWPDARSAGASWTDQAGNLWLFGGYGLGSSGLANYNDLWKYTISTNTWTLINAVSTPANQYGVYGTKGIPSSSNRPGGRSGQQFWTDKNGNFWLFGGDGFGENGAEGILGDLWKYNSITNQWTWVNGGSTVNYTADYGYIYVPSPSNHPGARFGGATWVDPSNNLWILGGLGYTTSPIGASNLNDMWEYNIATNEWTWVNGENTANSFTAYGTMGVPSFDNRPGAFNAAVTWADEFGNLWLYGGRGTTQTEFGELNSLWRYNPSTFEWTWMNGNIATHVPPVYGTQGISSASNQPGARQTSVGWIDNLGHFWLFAGGIFAGNTTATLSRNDVWKITLTVVPVKLISFNGKLKDENTSLNWTVENEVNFDHYEIERSTNGTAFNKVKQVKALGIRNYNADDNISELQEGLVYYRLKMVDIDGKYTYSKVINFHIPVNVKFNLSPNPANGFTRITFSKTLHGEINMKIADVTGQIVLKNNFQVTGNGIIVPVIKLSSGSYAVTIVYKGKRFVRSLVIAR